MRKCPLRLKLDVTGCPHLKEPRKEGLGLPVQGGRSPEPGGGPPGGFPVGNTELSRLLTGVRVSPRL